ncbi:hypothetical protein U1Q18_019318 [Sarracenia purpurea var. burkii]
MGKHGTVEEAIKKGPWTPEEDEVLINFVNKYGPRNWSSVRFMGLLPRTGKSCRLRWVNKLRPNLKIGCKFSAEEEGLLTELQERFGNKWAKIASYFPGRTDNDVKNFWSTRQKRLARILQSSPLPLGSKSQKNKGKAHAVHELLQPSSETPLHLFFPQLRNPNLDLPLLSPENYDPSLELAAAADFLDSFAIRRDAELEIVSQLNLGSPFLGELEGAVAERDCGGGDSEKLRTPDSFFDELPDDIFDYLEEIPGSSPLRM